MADHGTATVASDDIAYLIARANRRLEEDLGRSLRAEGVPIEQFRILDALARGGPQPMGAIAEAALVERPTLTKIIDRMTAAGLVFRMPDTEDRRRINVVMSPEGEALWRRLAELVETQSRELTSRMDADGADALRDLLRALA